MGSYFNIRYNPSMVMISKLLSKYALITDQVDKEELYIILTELDKVLSEGIAGDVVEFGCYKGTTSLFLMRLIMEHSTNKQLWLYDSFAGLPGKTVEDDTRLGDEFKPGELMATKAEVLRNFAHANLPRPIIKKGWFNNLTERDVPARICFAYFDGDFYASIKDSFQVCQAHFVPGAVIVIDDYANDHLPGAKRAVDEWLTKCRYKIKNVKTISSLAVITLMV